MKKQAIVASLALAVLIGKADVTAAQSAAQSDAQKAASAKNTTIDNRAELERFAQQRPTAKNPNSKLDPALVDRLAQLGGLQGSDNTLVDVVYALETDGMAQSRAGTTPRFADANAQMIQALEASGHQILYQSPFAGMIAARGTEAAIRSMDGSALVETIFLEGEHRQRLNLSRIVSQANLVNTRGSDGSGVRVGVVENGRIANHAALPPDRRILCRPDASLEVDNHKTSVAGIVQSMNASIRGIAPGATVIDAVAANLGDAETMAATDCALAAGAQVVNMSFGSDTNGEFDAFARYVDRIAHLTGRTIVVAISNNCNLSVGSPEVAFNALGVGSYSDRNTLTGRGDRHSCDRVVRRQHSAFFDPFSINFDRQEPKMVAPGDEIRTTNARGGFSNVVGTSFAAPHVTGTAALLIATLPELADQGELLRAILMASARKNVDGASGLSDRAGAGALQVAAAERVLLEGDAHFVETPGGDEGFPQTQSFFAKNGQRVRVALVWSHKLSGSDSFEPTTDLDLEILDPLGNSVALSQSFDNSYEFVEFTAPRTGDYTALVENFRPSDGEEYLGLAISRFFK